MAVFLSPQWTRTAIPGKIWSILFLFSRQDFFPQLIHCHENRGGLKDTGAPNGRCSKNVGQVYARGAKHGNEYGIMYSWYVLFSTCNPTP